jgi:hypothetical protein
VSAKIKKVFWLSGIAQCYKRQHSKSAVPWPNVTIIIFSIVINAAVAAGDYTAVPVNVRFNNQQRLFSLFFIFIFYFILFLHLQYLATPASAGV